MTEEWKSPLRIGTAGKISHLASNKHRLSLHHQRVCWSQFGMEAPDESVTQSSTPMHADALDGADEHAEQAGGNDVRAAPTSQAETAASEAPSDAVLPQADGPRPSAEDPIAAAAAMAAAAAAAAVAAAAAEYQQPKAAAHEATAVEQPEAQHAAPEPEGAPPVTPEAPAVEVPLPAEEPPASTPPRAPAPAEAAHDFAPEAEGSSAKMDRPAMFEIGGYKPGVAGDSSAQRGSETGGVQPHPPPGERPPGARATSTGGSRPPSRANSRLGTPAGPTSRFDSVFDFTNERLVDHTWKKSSSEVRQLTAAYRIRRMRARDRAEGCSLVPSFFAALNCLCRLTATGTRSPPRLGCTTATDATRGLSGSPS